jgi:hypothetical protein
MDKRRRLGRLTKKWKEEKVWGLDRVFTFGQYKGCTLRDVIDVDFNYIRFLKERGRIELSGEAYRYLDDQAETWPYKVTDRNKFDDPLNFRR